MYKCDGVADCVDRSDERSCQFPRTCQEWWYAGYQESGVYNICKCLFIGINCICKFRYLRLTCAGPQIRVHNRKLFFLFLNQNICCGYSKEPSMRRFFEHPKRMLKLMGKKIITNLRWTNFAQLDLCMCKREAEARLV